MENLDVEMAEQIVKLNEENKVLKKALELACEDIKETGLFAITDKFENFKDVYIKSAEQKLNKDN